MLPLHLPSGVQGKPNDHYVKSCRNARSALLSSYLPASVDILILKPTHSLSPRRLVNSLCRQSPAYQEQPCTTRSPSDQSSNKPKIHRTSPSTVANIGPGAFLSGLFVRNGRLAPPNQFSGTCTTGSVKHGLQSLKQRVHAGLSKRVVWPEACSAFVCAWLISRFEKGNTYNNLALWSRGFLLSLATSFSFLRHIFDFLLLSGVNWLTGQHT
jgi:hypothetical protein